MPSFGISAKEVIKGKVEVVGPLKLSDRFVQQSDSLGIHVFPLIALRVEDRRFRPALSGFRKGYVSKKVNQLHIHVRLHYFDGSGRGIASLTFSDRNEVIGVR